MCYKHLLQLAVIYSWSNWAKISLRINSNKRIQDDQYMLDWKQISNPDLELNKMDPAIEYEMDNHWKIINEILLDNLICCVQL